MAKSEILAATGSYGVYLWLTTGQHDLHTLLRRCPQVLRGRYIVVTSHDSGPLLLSEEEKREGWQSRNEIAYSPQLASVDKLRHGMCSGFDEWYVFESPRDLGKIWLGNIFESPTTAGHVSTFVNFAGFALHNPNVRDLVNLFWKQIDWIQCESYIADGDLLTFVSRNRDAFDAVRHALIEPDSTL
jgi:hypothetical protein